MNSVPLSQGLGPVTGEPAPDGADCVACGRCCHHGPHTVQLHEADERRMGPVLLARFTITYDRPPGFRFMANEGTHCGALDVSVPGLYPCAVYDSRPAGCRVVEPGSPCCLEARQLGHLGRSVGFVRSLDPAPAADGSSPDRGYR